MVDELEDDLPEFTAQNLDDFDEGVGPVRIITDAASESDEGVISSLNISVDGSQQAESAATDTPENQAAEKGLLPSWKQVGTNPRRSDVLRLKNRMVEYAYWEFQRSLTA